MTAGGLTEKDLICLLDSLSGIVWFFLCFSLVFLSFFHIYMIYNCFMVSIKEKSTLNNELKKTDFRCICS